MCSDDFLGSSTVCLLLVIPLFTVNGGSMSYYYRDWDQPFVSQ